MNRVPFVKAIWKTKKMQIPFTVGNTTIIWETSYGMTLENPGQLPSDELRNYLDDAVQRAFDEDLSKFTNSEAVKKVLEIAHKYPEENISFDMEMNTDNKIEVKSIRAEDSNIETKTIDELIKGGYLRKGVNNDN